MKLLMSALFGFAMVTAATAQQVQMPQTVAIKDKLTGKIVGTATAWDRRITFRDADGRITGSIVVTPDGKLTRHDPNGKILEKPQ